LPRVAVVGGNGWLGSQLIRALATDPLLDVDSLRIDGTKSKSGFVRTNDFSLYSKIICLVGGRRLNAYEYEMDFSALSFLMRVSAEVGIPVIHLGSAAEIGNPPGGDLDPKGVPSKPTSQYGEWKLRATELVIDSSEENCVLRLFNVAGFPLKQSTAFQMLVGPFVELTSNVTVRTPGLLFVRDYLDVKTICGAIREACFQDLRGMYDLCSGVGVRASEIIEWAEEATGLRASISISGDVDKSEVIGNNSKIEAALGQQLRCDWSSLRQQLRRERAGQRRM